jgi:hypothetical protein
MLNELISLAVLVFKEQVLSVENAVPKKNSVHTHDRPVYWEFTNISSFKLAPTLTAKHIVKYTFVLLLNVKQTVSALLLKVLCVLS